MKTQTIIGASDELLSSRLPHSALALLNAANETNFNLNTRRHRALRRISDSRPLPGINMLVALDGTIGVAVPLSCILGKPGDEKESWGSFLNWSSTSQKAFMTAYHWCESRLSMAKGSLPGIVPVTPDLIHVDGHSAGLASALAILSKVTGSPLPLPVFATGAIGANGQIETVGHMAAKLAMAKAELANTDGIVLAPRGAAANAPDGLKIIEVDTLEEAITAVFGNIQFNPDASLLDFGTLLAALRNDTDHRKVVRQLRAIHVSSLPPADQAIWYLEMGVRLRHTGDIAGANEAHGQISDIQNQTVVECLAETVTEERIEIEVLRSKMASDVSIAMRHQIEQRLARGVMSVHNRVRIRGMLAELKSTLGEHQGVLALREANLEAQQGNAAMKKEIQWTLCGIVWEAARAGNDAAFFKYARQLASEATALDTHQQAYNSAAMVRGLIVLKRYDELASWLTGKSTQVPGAPGIALLQMINGAGPIQTHPSVSTARALVRMYRKNGRPDQAIALANRIDTTATEPLMRWLCLASQIEKAMALVQKGDDYEAEGVLHNTMDIFFSELAETTKNIPSFKHTTIADATNLDEYFWEPLLDGIYH
ncbi:MAG: hypothetical protein JXX14_03340 [Deltaproteobacteria bacterium]|nr:hypothetical protein [Deltaproteobacteria bacterium]